MKILSGTSNLKLSKKACMKRIIKRDIKERGKMIIDGDMDPHELAQQGNHELANYMIDEIQKVYRLQGVKINDKHFEVIVRQMMRKVKILDPGDSKFLEGELVHKLDFKKENDRLYHMMIVEDSGDETDDSYQPGSEINARQLRERNSILQQNNKKLITARDAVTAVSKPMLQGITRASLQTKSFMSAASFQETTKVLNNAAIRGMVDDLSGLKENVIIGHQIPAGTGMRFKKTIVGSKKQLEILESTEIENETVNSDNYCLLYTSPSPRDQRGSRMPSSA